MPLRLRVFPPSSGHAGEPFAGERTVDFDDGVGQIRIGRRTDLELSLAYSRLSGVHARLVRAIEGEHKADWLLEDLGSTNGTFVGGERLKPGTKCVVTAGMQIKFAEIKVIFDGEVGKVGKEVRKEASAKVPIEIAGKVQAEAASKDTGKVSGKVQSEVSAKNTAKTVGEGSGKSTSKPHTDPSARTTGKVQAEAPSKDTGKLTTVQSDASSRSPITKSPITKSPISKSPVKATGTGSSKLPAAEPTQTYVRGQAPDPVMPAATPEQVPYLKAVAGLTEGATTFRLMEHNHVYMFGRTRRCEFRVSTAEVSREHASFTRRADGIYVDDLGSVNGVLVNNTRVKEYRLFDGDLIQIGHVKLRLFDPTETRGRTTDSAVATPSRLAPHADGESRYEPPPAARADASSTFHSELHPAVAGHLAQDGGGTDAYRPRRLSVRVRLSESWETSSRFRYGIVIVAASLLAICAVLIGFRLAG